uniref:Uncharacterized protein n=1 Tax=Cucumis melo TaxID=3656 RepID=A0A9I9EAF1_CUCME
MVAAVVSSALFVKSHQPYNKSNTNNLLQNLFYRSHVFQSLAYEFMRHKIEQKLLPTFKKSYRTKCLVEDHRLAQGGVQNTSSKN